MGERAEYNDFFVAAAGVAGALIGLLFVALSVSQGRLAASGDGAVHRVRAAAALTSFSNALLVSLFGLMPRSDLRAVALTAAVAGLASVAAMLLSLGRARALRREAILDLVFVASLAVVFAFQLRVGLHGDDVTSVGADLQTLTTLVVVCFLVGIARSWELIGGPTIRIRGEIAALGRELEHHVRDARASTHNQDGKG